VQVRVRDDDWLDTAIHLIEVEVEVDIKVCVEVEF
jgi:hypothetical protein